MSFPLFQGKPHAVFLDDDHCFLDSITYAVPKNFCTKTFSTAKEVDSYLSNQEWLVRKEQYMLNQIGLPSEETSSLKAALEYLSWDDRSKIVSVLVSDQVMPLESGVSVCARHEGLGLRRILMTGAGDSDLAVNAFNDGYIETFLPKQTNQLLAKLRSVLIHQNGRSMEIRAQHMQHCMTARQVNLLSLEGTPAMLRAYLDELKITEYVSISDPLGVLGRTDTGTLIWIQIEDGESTEELCRAMEDSQWNQEDIAGVRSGRLLPNIELTARLNGVMPQCARARSLCTEGHSIGAHFELQWPAPDQSRY